MKKTIVLSDELAKLISDVALVKCGDWTADYLVEQVLLNWFNNRPDLNLKPDYDSTDLEFIRGGALLE